ncbi:MAG: helix-turn-helix domain-containing protein [Prevotella sp.]|nr:helix-turn-helix domain-containing protein [Prevotella sp.]
MRRRLSLLMWLLACTLSIMAVTSRRVFQAYNASHGLADNSAQTIRCATSGRLVITTMGQINFFDGNRFTFIDSEKENMYPLPRYSGNYHVYVDKYHHMWLKNTHTVTCVDLLTEMFVNSVEEVFREFGIDEVVEDFFVDGNGVAYLLTNKGLYSVDSKQYYKVREKCNLQDLETYKGKYLLLFYETGEVDVIELSTGTSVYTAKAYEGADVQKYNRSSVLYKDENIFYQIRNGSKEAVLQAFDITRWEWRRLLETPYHLNNIDKKGSLIYLPCEYGYWVYDLSLERATKIDELRMFNGRSLKTDVNALCFDRQGGMWIGTEKWGLLYSRPNNPPFTAYTWDQPEALKYDAMLANVPSYRTFKGKTINSLLKDSRGWIWVGTSSGLHLYQKESDNLPHVFTRRNGLLNNVIHSIVEDKQHNIWVGTSYGISCLKLDSKGGLLDIISYNQYDNLPDESFVNGKAICLPDSTIVMQSLDHVITFNPNRMATLHSSMGFDLHPELVGLMVNGNRVRTGDKLNGKVILDLALIRMKEFNFDYDQNSLSLTFSALNHFRPQQTYYRVRVKEMDNVWKVMTPYNSQGLVDNKGQFHLPLPSLKPGTYTIELQSSMSIDDWETEPREWVVHINEPWWRATGLFILLGLLLLGLFLLNVYLYVRNINMKAHRISEEKGILRRIKLFVDRCVHTKDEVLAPQPEEISGISGDVTGVLSEEFMQIMLKLIPFVEDKRIAQLSMKMLSEKAEMDMQSFYSLVSSNIYKNPHELVKRVMMNRAEEMLCTTGEDIADIAEKCRFSTPNYFIATFFREYHMLPEEYRRKAVNRQ